MTKCVLFCALSAVLGSTGLAGMAQAPAANPTVVPGSQAVRATPVSPDQNAPKASDVNPFPPVNPKNFTASSPSVETVNSFLHALWGADENRLWSVAAIAPTTAAGVVRVQVYVAEKPQSNRIGQTVLYLTPDGRHVIAGDMVSFGAHPFAETRALLQRQADGPARGAAGKDLEMVEFVDLQCPTCKAAQSTVDQLLQDFPQAHIVFENDPQSSHVSAFQAAAVGNCVRQSKGDTAFFSYVQKVYDTQADLTPEKADATLRAAVTAAGADPAVVMTCAALPATQEAVNAVTKMAADAGVISVPTLVVNGRLLPLSQLPYETLKKFIVFQGSLDGISVKEQPSLKTLK